MAKKQQSSYLFNARRSLKNLGKSTIEDYLPNTTNAIGSIKDGYKSATDVGDSRISFNIIRSRLRSNPLIEFGNSFLKNAYVGIKTGNFYKSTEESFGLDMGEMEGVNFDEFISDIDDANAMADSDNSEANDWDVANESTKSLQGTISEGDQAVVTTTIEASKANATAITNSLMVGITELKGTLMKSDSTLGSISNNILESGKALSSLLTVQTESLVELKALRTMFGEYALTNQNDASNGMQSDSLNGTKKWYEDLKYGENKKDGVKELLHGVMRSIDSQKSQGVMSQLMSMLPMLTMMYGNNPLGAVKDLFIMPKIEEKYGIKNLTSKIESAVSDIPTMINKQFKTMSLSDNALLRGIGQDMKVTPNLNASIRTDRYVKDRKVFFDGMTREAIINVIPTQLSSIVSLLSGKERTLYNYERGKFQTMSDAKNMFKEYMPKLDYDYSTLSSLITRFLPTEDSTAMNGEVLDKFVKTLMERLAERGYDLSDVKNMRYDDMLSITDIDSDNFDKSDYIKIKTAITNAEKDRYAYDSINSLNKKINYYIMEKQKYIKEQADTLRKTGLISTVNRSELLDSGATLNMGNPAVSNVVNPKGEDTPKTIKSPFVYTNLFSDLDKDSDYNKFLEKETPEDKVTKRSIFKYKLSDDDLGLIDKYNDTKLGGLNAFGGNLKHTAQMILSSRFFDTNKMNEEKWFKDFESKSDYDYRDILFLMKKKEEAKAKARKEAEENGEEIPDNFDEEYDKKDSFFSKAKFSELRARVNKNFTRMMSEFKDETSDVLGEVYTYYDKHQEGVKKFAKASAIGLGGLGLTRLLKGTSIGKSVGALGIMSPIGLAAAGIGTGLFLNRHKIMDAIVGTDENRAKFAKRNYNIMKYSLANTAGLAVGSGALSLLTGGAIGMMGPVGLAIGGLAMGISSQSSKFNEIMFGNGENSFSQNLKEWLFGKEDKKGLLSGKMSEVKKVFKKMGNNLEGWFKTQIGYPIRDIYKTVSITAGNLIQKLGSGLTGIPMQVGLGVKDAISRSVGKPLMAYLEKGFGPIGKMISNVFKKTTKFAGNVISAPFKFARTVITGKTDDSSYAERFYGKDYDSMKKEEKKQMHKEQEMNVKVQKSDSLSSLEDEATSKSEKKKLRKLYVKKTKGIENDDEEDEAGKGIDIRTAKKYYYNQKSATYSGIAFKSGASLSSNGCGLMVMAQALSIATKQKITPLHLLTESEKYQHNDSGLPRDFFRHMCGLYDVPFAVYESPNSYLIRDALSKDASVILDMADVETGTPHYVLITKANKNEEFIYSDPARKVNMKLPQEVMMAKAKKLFCVIIFPRKSEARMMAREFYSKTNAPRIDYTGTEEAFQKNKPVTRLTNRVNGINDVYDTSSIEDNKKSKFKLSGHRYRRKLEQATSAEAEAKLEEDKYIRKIYNEVKGFRANYVSGKEDIEDTIDLSTTGVAYNLEYIRRILVREYGKVNDKDIDGSTGMIDALKRYQGKVGKRIKRAVNRAKNFAKDFTTFMYDSTIGFVKRKLVKVGRFINSKLEYVGKKLHAIMLLPKKLYQGMQKYMKSFGKGLIKVKDKLKGLIPSKATIKSAYKTFELFTERTYKASKILVKDLRAGLTTVIKDIRTGTMSLFKSAVKGIKGTAKFAMGFAKDTYGLMKKGFNAFSNTWIGKRILHPLETGKSIVDAFKKKVNVTLAPREVFVTGGTINTVQTVEAVKSVGAVDLDYTESLNKKKTSLDTEIKKSIKDQKPFKDYNKYKEVDMKRGVEYSKIDKRQDAENKKAEFARDMVPVPEKKEGGFMSSLLRNSAFGLGLKGAIGVATGIVTSIASGLGLVALTKPGKELIGGVYNQFGLNGELDAESAGLKAPRKLLKRLGTDAIKGFTKIAAKTGLSKQAKVASKFLTKALKNVAKEMPSKIIRFLENIFTSKVVMKLIPEKYLAKLLLVIPKIAKLCAKRSSKSLTKAGVRLGAYAFPPLGAIVDIGFAAFDLVSGMRHAKDYFSTNGHVTMGMRMTAGVVNCLVGFAASKFPPLAFIPVDLLTKMVYDAFGGDSEEKGYNPKYADSKDAGMGTANKVDSIKVPKFEKEDTSKLSVKSKASDATFKLATSSMSGFGGAGHAMNDNAHIESKNSWLSGFDMNMLRKFAGSKTDESKEESTLVENAKPNGAKIGNYKIDDPKGILDSYKYVEDRYNKDLAKKAMGIAWAESNWKPTVKNRIGAEGLFQILKRYRKSWGFKPSESPSTMPALEQTKRVVPEILKKVENKNATPTLTNLYSALHYPVAVNKSEDYILYGKHKNPTAYKYNKGIDLSFGNRDGNVSKRELGRFVQNKANTALSLLPQLYTTKPNTSNKFISQKYGKYNMLDMGGMKFKDAGCGPAVMGMLLSDLGIKFKMENLVKLALNKRTSPVDGTPIEYFPDVLGKFGIRARIVNTHLVSAIINELKAGRCAVVLTKNGKDSNHYILARKITGKGKLVISDPEKTKSETVDIMDYRIRNAIAVVTYADRKTQRNNNFFEGMYSGFGQFGGLLNNLTKEALNIDLEKPNIKTIVNDFASDNLDKYKREAESLLQTPDKYTAELNAGVSKVNAERNRIKKMTADIVAKREALAKGVIPKIDTKIDTSRIDKSIEKVLKEMPKVNNLPNIQEHRNNKTEDTSSAFQNAVLEKLSAIVDLLKGGIDVRKKQTPLVINDKKVYETNSGKAKPIIIDGETESDGGNADEWIKMISRIAHGA